MGCSSCSSGGGTPRGCQNNGTCSSGGCDKLGVFDWLANMQLPSGKSQFDILEIRFKNSRKGFFRNLKGLSLNVGDVVVVESSPGYDVGVVSIVGELARIQVQKKAPNFKPHEARKIMRIASQEDVDKWVAARGKEYETMHQTREMAIQLKLEMIISDVEFQGDGSKAIFYYTAEGRVDFRQLIKDMADKFRVRIEMKQIGARQESSRLGGIGSCGRELCCSTWLTDFRSVSTSAARYQQLSLNPQKLAGQCGKLKCCLNFELDMYLEAVKEFPSTNIKLFTKRGSAFHIKTDVFKRLMWYIYESDEPGTSGMIALSPERVAEVIKLNKAKENPSDLKDFKEEISTPKVEDYTNVVGQDDLNRFDDVFKKKRKKKKKPRPQGQAQGSQGNTPQAAKNPPGEKPKAEGGRPHQKSNNRNRNKRRKPNNNNPDTNNDKKD